MKYLILVFFALFVGCAIIPDKVTPLDATKISKVTVISLLGSELTLQKSTIAQQLLGFGKFEKDISVNFWQTDLEIEKAIANEIHLSGRKYLPTNLSAKERENLKLESQKVGNNLAAKALSIASSSGAEYAIIIRTASTVQRIGAFRGMTNPILLTCQPKDSLPRLEIMFRLEYWRIKDQTEIAGTPLRIEALYNGEIECEKLAQETDKKVENSFKNPFTTAIKGLAKECVANSGLTQITVK